MALDFGLITHVAQLTIRWVVACRKHGFKYHLGQLMGMTVKKATISIIICVLSS